MAVLIQTRPLKQVAPAMAAIRSELCTAAVRRRIRTFVHVSWSSRHRAGTKHHLEFHLMHKSCHVLVQVLCELSMLVLFNKNVAGCYKIVPMIPKRQGFAASMSRDNDQFQIACDGSGNLTDDPAFALSLAGLNSISMLNAQTPRPLSWWTFLSSHRTASSTIQKGQLCAYFS